MCGRYTRRTPLQNVIDLFGATQAPKFDEFTERPRYNVAPSQHVPIVHLNDAGQRVLLPARWGFIPSWTKDKPKIQPINAKAETVATSGVFRQAFARRRCLVPADGFYEWQGAKPPKQPYFIHMKDDGLFAFAGLWERWKPEEDAEPVETFTIITTEPNALMKPIHNRMPVIIDKADYAAWLAKGDADLLKPFPAGRMEAFRVGTLVNKPANEGPELIEAVQ